MKRQDSTGFEWKLVLAVAKCNFDHERIIEHSKREHNNTSAKLSKNENRNEHRNYTQECKLPNEQQKQMNTSMQNNEHI